MRRRFPLLLAAFLVLATAACASGGASADGPGGSGSATAGSASTSPAATPTEPEAESTVEISVSVTDGKVTPGVRRVDVTKDSRVRLLVTSDVDDEVHVHGYDIGESLEAGRPTMIEFVADQSGVFAVETHDGGLELVQLEVR